MTYRDDHVMLDLETVDNVPTSGIISIGAVVFAGPNKGREFYLAIDMQSALAAGLTSSEDTLAWWRKQSDQARAVFTDPNRVGIRDGLAQFAAFMAPLSNAKVWGNGASFDNAILSNAYRCCGIALPWKFWNDRCYRTAAARIAVKRVNTGTYHNALDDARSQADHFMANAPEAVV